MSLRKKTPSDDMKRFSFIMNPLREEKINELMKVYSKNTISSLFDHLLDIAISDPKRFDFIRSQDDTEERFNELNKLILQNKQTLDKITLLEKDVKELKNNFSEVKELLAIGLPAVKNHLNELKNKDKPLVSEDEEDL